MKTILKNKNNVIVRIMILILVIILQNCSKDDFETEVFDSLHNSDTFDTNVDFSFKVLNPYDFVGKYHNDGLQSIINEYGKNPKLKSETEFERRIKDLVVSYMEENDIFVSSGVNTSIDLSILSMIDKMDLNQIRLKNDNLFSKKKQQIYFGDLLNVFNNKISSPQHLINSINEIEYNIIMEKDLTEQEKSQLLITSAVAKYSTIFWIEVFLKDDNRGRGVRLKNGNESSWNFREWWENTFMPKAEEVVKADFYGAGSGAVMGAISGGSLGTVAAPGPGTITVGITGAVVGGAQGAIGSSALRGILVIFWQ